MKKFLFFGTALIFGLLIFLTILYFDKKYPGRHIFLIVGLIIMPTLGFINTWRINKRLRKE